MNAANLQLQGLMMAAAAVNRLLVDKGLITTEELDDALSVTEQTALGEDRAAEDFSPTNRDTLVFPIRILRLANRAPDGALPGFSELARTVGETKDPYNDQL